MSDMSYYRRRLPSERPSPMQYQDVTIIFEPKTGGIVMGWADADESGESHGFSFCSGDDYWWPDDIKWWAYAYIPKAEEVKK